MSRNLEHGEFLNEMPTPLSKRASTVLANKWYNRSAHCNVILTVMGRESNRHSYGLLVAVRLYILRSQGKAQKEKNLEMREEKTRALLGMSIGPKKEV